ncbi:hypothetical protein ACFCYB_03585, partial [Streptomyces sp. NPDC056309]|uniref:hypothetical protein n=1 Tax=Streptomyces sp. NPDC056309 TaxID=3345781 RepID=UPI0035DAB807
MTGERRGHPEVRVGAAQGGSAGHSTNARTGRRDEDPRPNGPDSPNNTPDPQKHQPDTRTTANADAAHNTEAKATGHGDALGPN